MASTRLGDGDRCAAVDFDLRGRARRRGLSGHRAPAPCPTGAARPRHVLNRCSDAAVSGGSPAGRSRLRSRVVAGAVLGCVSTDRVKHAAGVTRHERAGGRRDPPGANMRVRRRRRADQSAARSHIAVAYGSRHDRAGSFSTGHSRRARRAAPNRGACFPSRRCAMKRPRRARVRRRGRDLEALRSMRHMRPVRLGLRPACR